MLQTTTTRSALLSSGVILEVYPRSYRAARGGSEGDLKGIIEKLDYLKWLGVQNLWLPPIFPSPLADGGYDVSDYYHINPQFGTLADFEELVAEAGQRGIGIIMDLVVNHTSTEHEWFTEALHSPKSPFRDRYVFRNAPAGKLPNNHLSVFGGPAWQPVPGETGSYYYHTFAASQPDLNYEHPAVRAEMKRITRYWLDHGAHGVRVDAVHYVGKDPDTNEPIDPSWDGGNAYRRLQHSATTFRPYMFEFMQELCAIAAEYTDRIVIFEACPLDGSDPGMYRQIYASLDRRVGAPFYFGLFFTAWNATAIKQHVEDFLSGLAPGAVAVWNVSNHDQMRVASRLGVPQARVAMAMILTLPGIPTLYYGDELGMVDGPVPAPSQSDDPRIGQFSRDIVRTPMQWTADETAGFTAPGTLPWLKPNPDSKTVNVRSQQNDPNSMLNFTQKLIHLRRSTPALQVGKFKAIDSGSTGVYAYARVLQDTIITVILNLTSEAQTIPLPSHAHKQIFGQAKAVSGRLTLNPNAVSLFIN